MRINTSIRSNSGFTLLELMVAVAFMALLMTYFAMNINSAGYKLKSAAFKVRSTLQKARLEAVKRNRPVFVDFDITGDGNIDANDNATRIWFDSDPGSGITEETIETVRIVQGGGGSNGPTLGSIPPIEGGPTKKATDNSTDDITYPNDGVAFGTGKRIKFKPDGTSLNGTIYLYIPKRPEAGTYAIVLNQMGRSYIRYRQNHVVSSPSDSEADGWKSL